MTIDVSSYKENGFFLAKHFFAPEEVERVRGDAKAVFIAQMLRLNIISTDQPSEHEFEHGMFQFFQTDIQSFTNCGKQAQHLISLHRLSLDDRII
ncbi:MAG TPA: hypothetical protein VFT30_09165, partial [Nitrospira sp.]|nr:hypothetical protein [Nitrospira sp.]